MMIIILFLFMQQLRKRFRPQPTQAN